MRKKPSELKSLRVEAEKQLVGAPFAQTQAQSAEELLHELQVHQIELEMQNEELRRARTELEESRDRYVNLYEFAPVGYLTLSRAGQISEINLAGATLLGLERNKLLKRRFDHFVCAEDRDRWHLMFVNTIGRADRAGIELALLRSDNSTLHVHLDCQRAENGASKEMQVALTDISSMELNKHLISAQDDLSEQLIIQMQNDAALRESEERLRVATATARDAIILLEGEHGTIVEWNPAAETIFGYAQSEAVGQELHELLTPLRFREKTQQGLSHFTISGTGAAIGQTSELMALRKDGTEFPIELSISSMQIRGKWYATGIARDISVRKQAETAVMHANRALATLGTVNRQLVYSKSEDELLQSICQAIVTQRGYRASSVGYAEQDARKTIRIMAHSGQNGNFPDAMQITWAETGQGMGPSGCAIRSGKTQVCQDIVSDPRCMSWRDAALENGFASSITLPLLNAEKIVFGILTVNSDEPNTFIPGEITLMEEMAEDLAFGVRTLRMRQERDHALEQNQNHLLQMLESYEDTVRAIASIVEMRDPYTSGHQIRVADLAATIAKGMSE